MNGREDTIVNSAITAQLWTERLDLDEIAASLPDVEFDPEKIVAVIVKRATYSFMLFHSGKLICAGKASIKEKKQEIRKFVKLLQECGIVSDGRIRSFQVVNIVSVIDVGSPLDIEKMLRNTENTSYEPERFPALTWELEDCVAQVYVSGKAVVTGVRDEKILVECQNRVLSVLKEYIIDEGDESIERLDGT